MVIKGGKRNEHMDIKFQPKEISSPLNPSRDQAMLGLDLFSNKSLTRRHLDCSAQTLKQTINPASSTLNPALGAAEL